MTARLSSLGLVAALLAAALPAAAGPEDLEGTGPGDLPEGGQFDGADGCLLCHGGGFQGDRTYLPFDSWAGTMMGNAARDPVFRAALAIANQDSPGVGSFCLRCHSPIAFVRGHASPPDGSAFDAVDMQGVGCDTCHRATASGPPEAPYWLGDAQLVYTPDPAKRGPYADSKAPVHESAVDALLGSARFCGQCHQVTNPARRLRDATGAETALAFPFDTTYEEWAASDFARNGEASCVDCHTRKKTGLHPVVTTAGAPERPDPRDHAFAGGNLFGIRAVMASAPERAQAFPEAFALALARTEETLASAASITIASAPATAAPDAPLTVTVRVENLTGHKFPTGYAEGRRAWISLSLVDEEGAEIALVGGYDATSGEIQEKPPTHVYRAQHGHWNGTAAEPGENLALHDMILSDTRIPPRGFVPTATTLPTPEIAYSDGAGGLRSFDEATFTVAAPASAQGVQRLVARVQYQSMTRHYVEHLAAVNVTDASGAALLDIYHATGEAPPFVVASAEAPIDFGGGSGGGGSGGGSGSGGGNGSGSGGCGCRLAGQGSGAAAVVFGLTIALGALGRARRGRRSG